VGARSVVERAFQSALLRVGFDGLRQAARCWAELTRFCSEHSSEVTQAVALASAGAGVLDTCSDGTGPTDSAALAGLLESQGLFSADARWIGLLWAPVLAHLQEARPIDARWQPPDRLDSSSETLRADHHDLRPQLTGFLGRQRDIAVSDELLTRARLVTLVGPGGVGKTRLALEVVGRVAGRYPDGVWMAELAPVGPDTDATRGVGIESPGAMSAPAPDQPLGRGVFQGQLAHHHL
jgi:hypothetical protein